MGQLQTSVAPRSRGARVGSESLALVLVADSNRRSAITHSIRLAGWRVLPCVEAGEAAQQLHRWRTQLAIVELAANDSEARESFRRFAAELKAGAAPLVIISDQQPTDADEVWARQAGAWLYLPAMGTGDDLTDLCREALKSLRRKSAATAAV